MNFLYEICIIQMSEALHYNDFEYQTVPTFSQKSIDFFLQNCICVCLAFWSERIMLNMLYLSVKLEKKLGYKIKRKIVHLSEAEKKCI